MAGSARQLSRRNVVQKPQPQNDQESTSGTYRVGKQRDSQEDISGIRTAPQSERRPNTRRRKATNWAAGLIDRIEDVVENWGKPTQDRVLNATEDSVRESGNVVAYRRPGKESEAA